LVDEAIQKSWKFGSKFARSYPFSQPDPGGFGTARQEEQFLASTQIRARTSHERASTCTGEPQRSNGSYATDKHQALHRYGRQAQHHHNGWQNERWKYRETDDDGYDRAPWKHEPFD
jgi:hypothetical protein